MFCRIWAGCKNGCLFFFYVEKAFDGIWVSRLIHKCIRIKIPLRFLLIIKHFLTGRTFREQTDTDYSKIKVILAGVPQCSVLGPMLFNVYMHEFNVLPPVCLVMHTDDTAVYMTHKKKDITLRTVEQSGPKTESWYDRLAYEAEHWKVKGSVYQ